MRPLAGMPRFAITDLTSLIQCLLRVFGVFRGYLDGKNTELHGRKGKNRNENKLFFKVIRHEVLRV